MAEEGEEGKEGEKEEEETKRNYLVCTKSLNWFGCTQEKRIFRVKSFLLFPFHLPCLYASIPFLSLFFFPNLILNYVRRFE